MFEETFETVAESGKSKVAMMHSSPLGYFIASCMAGVFIAFGSVVSLTAGGLLGALPYAKLVAGLLFCSALSLVIMAGCELFTGNNLSVGSAFMTKKVSFSEMIRLFGFCYLGNLTGSLLICLIVRWSGVINTATAQYIASVAVQKVSPGIPALFLRGVLCNICVCLAVWCSAKMTSESGKLIMVIWCIMIFMVSGFEHSVANMSILSLGVLDGAITISQWLKNLIPVTLGNLVGGMGFVAVPYWIISRKTDGGAA